MNEEIARVLAMLEAGTITAEQAENLIKAIKQEGAAPSAGAAEQQRETETEPDLGTAPCPSPLRDIQGLFRMLGEAAHEASRRQRRWTMWRLYSYLDRQEQERRKRTAEGTLDRVRFVLRERSFADGALSETARLREDLKMDRLALGVLRFALQDEFRIDIPESDVAAWQTVRDVADYVDRRGAAPAEETAG